MAHTRQSRPDSGRGFLAKALITCQVFPSSLGSGHTGRLRGRWTCWYATWYTVYDFGLYLTTFYQRRFVSESRPNKCSAGEGFQHFLSAPCSCPPRRLTAILSPAHIRTRGTSLGGVPREQKMLKGHLPRVIYHQVYNVY